MNKIPNRRLQLELDAKGYFPGPADGLLGAKTYQALVEYVSDDKAPEGVGKELVRWFPVAGIDTRAEVIQFIANCCHESNFQPKSENLNYSADRLAVVWPNRYAINPKARIKEPNALALSLAHSPEKLANNVYANRMGNIYPGDGYKFRGRGAPQLTGREAYEAVGSIVGMNFVGEPELVNTVSGGVAAAVGFWVWKKIGSAATRGDTVTVRELWNGGQTGLEQVKQLVAKQASIWPAD